MNLVVAELDTWLIGALLVGGVCCAGIWIVPWLCRRPRKYCLGPRPSGWWGRFNPWLSMRRPCGYDLSGAVEDDRGGVLCPECGRKHSNRRWLRRQPHRSMAGVATIVLSATALSLWCWPPELESRLVAAAPSGVLLKIEEVLQSATPRSVKRETRRRFDNFELTEEEIDRTLVLVVNDLRNDDIDFNAMAASDRLRGFGGRGVAALESALRSDDWQFRQYAASILQAIAGESPSRDLLRVSAEGLADDSRNPAASRVELCNANDCLYYLSKHAKEASEFLLVGMNSQDGQLRFLSAVVAGEGGVAELVGTAVPILVEHLGSNDISEDGIMAFHALAGFGASATSVLESMGQSGDAQRDAAVAYLVWKFKAWPMGDAPRPPKLPRLSQLVEDPLAVPLDWLRVPWGLNGTD